MIITQELKKWGNGAGVRLPKEVTERARISINQKLSVTVEGQNIILTPVKDTSKKSLQQLMKGVTPELVGGEVNWGHDVGAEKW